MKVQPHDELGALADEVATVRALLVALVDEFDDLVYQEFSQARPALPALKAAQDYIEARNAK